MTNKSRWITETGLSLALLIVIQMLTSPLKNTLLTGSFVNLVLIVAGSIVGLSSGLTVAVLSPFVARMFGMGPAFLVILPFIALGNMVLVLVWHLVTRADISNTHVKHLIACVAGAISKFLVLYLTIVKFVVPILIAPPEPQAQILSGMFSVPQLVTAVIGGLAATAILPILSQVRNRKTI
ncbi:ECF transporter S component [Vagococcus acidifermentans]|uniref:ECF transporter S component n=1 Tax=Vagococcus acidifermentans TaxID=564710 RepID=A0A430AQ50_9ENTE|nr:ECF transporter S component [Vagococcus acidifermentans]RSU10260.1 ECF transporter S component [Vagococcus acidifermentans]